MEKLGIETLKKALAGIIAAGIVVDKALEDKEIDRAEALQIGLKSINLGIVVVFNWNNIKKEYADLDSTEREELKVYIKEEFDLEDDYVEEKIEKAFNVAIAIQEFFAIQKAA